MSIDSAHIVAAIVIGIGATLTMDAWNFFLKRAFGIASLNYCLLGRWLRHMPHGRFRHASIGKSEAQPHECAVGWTAHYSIGVTLALLFVFLTRGAWLERPSLPLALLFGIVTVIFPFFVLQPSFGLGMAASRTPNPAQARVKSLATHTVFGVGLYLCAIAVRHVVSAGP